jgi:hypothetical protein
LVTVFRFSEACLQIIVAIGAPHYARGFRKSHDGSGTREQRTGDNHAGFGEIVLILLLSAAGWTWLIVLLLLAIGGYFFLDKLMSKGIYEESTEGRSRANAAFSELQTLVDPAHRHVMEERERKRGEHDDAGDDPDQAS